LVFKECQQVVLILLNTKDCNKIIKFSLKYVSNCRTIKQGAEIILGLLLSIIYTNDLPPILNNSSISIIFADDTSVTIFNSNVDRIYILSNFLLK
jgi:hypothetical protein